MKNQKQIWDKISTSWNKFKIKPSPFVEEFLKNKKGKILDLGCGSGRNFPAFPRKSQIYGMDFSRKMLKYASRKNKAKELICSSSEKIPYSKNFFDSIICISFLHCIPTKISRIQTIKEIYRTLKPKSQAFISVWSRNSPRLKNKPKECFVSWTSAGVEKRYTYIYDKEELEKELKNAGFKIIKIWEERNINVVVGK